MLFRVFEGLASNRSPACYHRRSLIQAEAQKRSFLRPIVQGHINYSCPFVVWCKETINHPIDQRSRTTRHAAFIE